MSEAPPATVQASRGRLRVILLIALAVLVAAAGVAVGLHWRLVGSRVAETDNAYVGGDQVPVMAQVAGPVAEVLVDSTQAVEEGADVVRLDAAEARFARERAEADLASAVRTVRQRIIAVATSEAQVASREAVLRRTQADLQRRERSAEVVSEEDLIHAREAAAVAAADLATARQALASARADVDGIAVDGHPLVAAAATRLRQAMLDEARCRIRSPVRGQVVQRTVQPGVRVQAGTTLLGVVPLDRLWVDANFKEGQLARIRPGLPVELTSDLWGGGVVYHGRVVGLAAGTGAAFALLPPQNASGNWIKIVQRVPVRIALDPAELAAHPLRIGLSMEARVRLDAEPAAMPAPAPRLAAGGDAPGDADRRIAAIIAANSGG